MASNNLITLTKIIYYGKKWEAKIQIETELSMSLWKVQKIQSDAKDKNKYILENSICT